MPWTFKKQSTAVNPNLSLVTTSHLETKAPLGIQCKNSILAPRAESGRTRTLGTEWGRIFYLSEKNNRLSGAGEKMPGSA